MFREHRLKAPIFEIWESSTHPPRVFASFVAIPLAVAASHATLRDDRKRRIKHACCALDRRRTIR
eukprot:scaffold48_cov311-Pinguiococcus_pyrenoidosus.AAC.34